MIHLCSVDSTCPSPAKPSNRLASLSGERCTRGRRLQRSAAMKHGNRFIDITGNRYGRLLVLSFSKKGEDGKTLFECKCDCGKTHTTRRRNLVSGSSTSCGCFRREFIGEKSVTHGLSRVSSKASEYVAWQQMKHRCLNPKNRAWHRYGGRGIKVCDEWINSFENFLADMGFKPTPTHSLDRFPNNDGNYEPGNCRWATKKEQANNRSK